MNVGSNKILVHGTTAVPGTRYPMSAHLDLFPLTITILEKFGTPSYRKI
jgi:hypothetical protein